MRIARRIVCGGILAIAAAAAPPVGEAHKPITSPFTYNEDVFPILRERCGSCHVAGGVAPMSLLTHADAVPWGESMRAELVAGHMPPWPVETARDRFRNAGGLTARELNVLLTWATGGTPPGDPSRTPPPVTVPTTWPLGAPDAEVPLPPVTMAAGDQERVDSFVVATGTTRARHVRAVDLFPGNAAIVRRAEISINETGIPIGKTASPAPRGSGSSPERRLALWIAGETPVPLDPDVGFELPAGAELAVRIHYKKTWQYEHKEMQDRSRVGIYFARDDATTVRAITLHGDVSSSAGTAVGGFGSSLPRPEMPVRILAMYPDPEMSNVRASVEILGTGRSHRQVFAMHADEAWPRRYWFKEPIEVPAGAGIEARFDPDAGASSARAMTVDVVER